MRFAIRFHFVSPFLAAALCRALSAAEPPIDLALQPPRIVRSPGDEYDAPNRGSQGVPSIEMTARGRLWAAWYVSRSKRGVESTDSYCVLATSADQGRAWSDFKLVVQGAKNVRTYDPCLWIDPRGRLWFFWAQSAGMQDGRMGVWAVTTDDPQSDNPRWSPPRRLANGIMMNKPTVTRTGDWLLPVGLWRDSTVVPNIPQSPEQLAPYTAAMLSHDLGEERGSNVIRSSDEGRTFERIGQVRIPGTRVDEHMLVERRDGALWMLVRNTQGIAQSTSTDGGRTWSPGSMFTTGGTTASKRFYIRRLKSGALLLIRNNAPSGAARTHMTAFVSDDDGATWSGGLVLDERESTYPDGAQAADGTIYVIYDHQRYTLNREGKRGSGSVLLAAFREQDVRAGEPSDATRLKVVINRLQNE